MPLTEVYAGKFLSPNLVSPSHNSIYLNTIIPQSYLEICQHILSQIIISLYLYSIKCKTKIGTYKFGCRGRSWVRTSNLGLSTSERFKRKPNKISMLQALKNPNTKYQHTFDKAIMSFH